MIANEGFIEFEDPSEYLTEISDWLKNAREVAKIKVNSLHEKQAIRFDQHRSTVEFQIGDLVRVWMPISTLGLTQKFIHRWVGPFVIKARDGPVNYIVQLVNGPSRHNKFHVEHLKRYVPREIPDVEPTIDDLTRLEANATNNTSSTTVSTTVPVTHARHNHAGQSSANQIDTHA